MLESFYNRRRRLIIDHQSPRYSKTMQIPSILNLPDQIQVQGIIPEDYNLDQLGIVIVDHGSRRDESNQYVKQIAQMFRQQTDFKIVEAAHMELAAPDIDTAYKSCVAQGARYIVVHPYFLAPGRHWQEDIPELARMASEKHPNTACVVTPPLGIHEAMIQIMSTRVQNALPSTSETTNG